jgi:cell division protein FtsN
MKLHVDGIKQQGSTLVGIIIGLVIGLAIALAVSLYMKRGDMPFVKKEPTAKADNGTAQGDKPKLPDPNESLYAKPSASKDKPALADVVPGKSGLPAGTKNPPLIDKTTGDPLGKLATEQAAKSGSAPPAAGAALPPVTAAAGANTSGIVNPNDDGSRYLIQAGAYKQPEEAEAMRAKLAMLGFQAQLSQRETDAGVLHRVRVGPIPDLERTNKIRQQLAQNGIESSIIKIK